VIEDATATCGCTKPEYTQGVIAKGASGKVKVTYNAADLNTFTKQVTVKIANVAEPIILNIGGEVVAASTAATKPSTAAKKKS
jgi:hypothetical protein